MDKLIAWIKTAWAVFIAAPVIAPLLDLLSHRSVLVLIAGFIGYSLIPQIQGLPPMWRDNLGAFVFIGVLLLSGRFTLEGILTARAGLPQTTEDYLKALLSEVLNPTPDSTPAGTTKWTLPPGTLVTGGSVNGVAFTARPPLPPDQVAEHG